MGCGDGDGMVVAMVFEVNLLIFESINVVSILASEGLWKF